MVARVVQARAKRDDLRPQRMWTVRKRVYGAAIDLPAFGSAVATSGSTLIVGMQLNAHGNAQARHTS